MFTDPQSVTVNAVAKSMPKILSEGTKSVYRTSDGLFEMTVSHQLSRQRIRSLVKISQRAIVPDPLTSANDYETLIAQIIIDRPEVGFDATTIGYLITGITAWINTAGVVGKLYGQES